MEIITGLTCDQPDDGLNSYLSAIRLKLNAHDNLYFEGIGF